LIFIFLFIYSYSQNDSIKPLTIGDKMPDILLSNFTTTAIRKDDKTEGQIGDF